MCVCVCVCFSGGQTKALIPDAKLENYFFSQHISWYTDCYTYSSSFVLGTPITHKNVCSHIVLLLILELTAQPAAEGLKSGPDTIFIKSWHMQKSDSLFMTRPFTLEEGQKKRCRMNRDGRNSTCRFRGSR